jgi:hypothetical protein
MKIYSPYVTGSLVVSGSVDIILPPGTTANVNAATASYISPTFISASAAASGFGSGGGGPESDPIFAAWSASAASQFAGTASFAQTARIATTASYSTTLGAEIINPQAGTIRLRNSNSSTISTITDLTASLASTASFLNTLNQNLTINGNLTVFGTASYTIVSASQLDVGTNTISVNVAEPAERFGGLIVYDSGSVSHQATASFFWDSLHNHWVYQNASGSTYSGGMFMSGPRNTGSLGDEPSLTKWFITRGDGGDHLNDTQIYSSASIHIVTGSLTVTEGITGSFTGSLVGTASYASNADLLDGTHLSALVLASQTSSMTVLSSSYALTASYALNGGGGGGGGGNITSIVAGPGISVQDGTGPTVTINATQQTNLGLTYAISMGYLMP